MEKTKYRLHKRKTTIVDKNTGEILEEQNDYIAQYINVNKNFCIMFYNEDIYKLNGTQLKMLQYLSLKAEYNTNEISIVSADKELMAQKLNLSKKSIANGLTGLTKHSFLERISKSRYRINLFVTWRGDLKTRERKMSVTFSESRKEIENEIKNNIQEREQFHDNGVSLQSADEEADNQVQKREDL